ncbi:glutathione hydrolase 1 proenzyme-like [Haemaphysalis longicornis]
MSFDCNMSNVRKEKKAYVVDGRETAPAAATWAFYEKTKRSRAATYVAIPGQMKALEALLNLTGTAVPWAELFHGAIELAHGGFAVGPELAAIIASKPDIGYTALSEIFWRKSKPLQAGDFVVQWQLADTLRKLAQRKASFYQGELARAIVSDLAHEGGVITEEDLASYEANVTEPISFPLAGGYTLLVPRPPAGGIYVGIALSVISRFLLEGTAPVSGDSMTAHRLVEALKFAFSRRSVLGDPKFFNMTQVIADAVSEETAAKIVSIIASHLGPSSEPSYYGQPFRGPLGFGTAHLGFLADNGDAVVVASSINSMFGSLVMSRRTGIIFNNDMLDFDLPHEFDQFNLSQTQRNQVSPRRRPLSSQSPCIVLQDGRGVAMLASGSGGGRIVSGIAQVIMRVLWMDQTVKEAVDAGRLHHQLVPDTLFIEDTVSEVREIVDTLRFLGHSIDVQSSSPSDIMAMANRVGATGEGKINAAYDYRRQTNDFVDGE